MFRNGNILSQILTTVTRKYPRTEASLMVSLSVMIKPISARCPEVRSHSNHKLHYVLKHYSYTFVMKITLASEIKNIVHRICSAHPTCAFER